jgi:hypothetical protein
LGALQKSRAYAKPRHEREQDKNAPTVFNKVEVKATKKSVRDVAVKLMKQNENFDEQIRNKSV